MTSVKKRMRNGRVRWTVRYRDPDGRQHSETYSLRLTAGQRAAELSRELTEGTWRDPRRGELPLAEWVAEWVGTRHDLRATTRARLETTLRAQVLPAFGQTPLAKITNSAVRKWVASMLANGLSAASVRKGVFALRQCLAAAIADNRLVLNPAQAVPLRGMRRTMAQNMVRAHA